ncbi:MAG: hypothetical protein NVSMB31_18350 [Vulcanimicrobiaceae bacterium]
MQHDSNARIMGTMKLIAAFMALGVLVLGVSAAAAERMFSLREIAAQNGFNYSWLLGEQAAAIERPGVIMVIRPGNPLYEINDASVFASSTPRSAGTDILIPDSIVRRIRSFAGVQTSSAVLHVESLSMAQAPISGALSLNVSAADGQEAVVVAGTGPSSAPVTLTVFTSVSPEIPDIILSRHDLVIDRSGAFSATISIAPDFLRGSLLTVRATSLDGVSPAQAHLLVGPPNPHYTVPAHMSAPVLTI